MKIDAPRSAEPISENVGKSSGKEMEKWYDKMHGRIE